LSVLLTCALGLVAGAGAAGTAQADFWNNAPGTSHWYKYASHKCLAVLTEAATAGFPVDQYDCHNGAAQGWGQERAARIVDHRSGGCKLHLLCVPRGEPQWRQLHGGGRRLRRERFGLQRRSCLTMLIVSFTVPVCVPSVWAASMMASA